jgi:hypothetical protein
MFRGYIISIHMKVNGYSILSAVITQLETTLALIVLVSQTTLYPRTEEKLLREIRENSFHIAHQHNSNSSSSTSSSGSRRLPTAAARVQTHVLSCGIL